MTNAITIRKGIPLPPMHIARPKSTLRLTMEKMEVGDSIEVPTDHQPKIAALCLTVGRDLKRKFATRKILGDGPIVIGVWRIL